MPAAPERCPQVVPASAARASASPDAPRRAHLLEVVGNGIVGGTELCVTRGVDTLRRECLVLTAI